VVVPVIVRRDAGRRAPMVMAVSTSAYGVGQGIASASVVPLAAEIGWRGAATTLAVPVVLAVGAWLLRMRAKQGDALVVPAGAPRGGVWREGDAWWLAGFFGMQAMLFYSASTWLPSQLAEDAGLSETAAGTALSV